MAIAFGLKFFISIMVESSLGFLYSLEMFLVFQRVERSLNTIKPHLWMKSLNPQLISLLNDPWCFDIPLKVQGTFINMSLIDPELQSIYFIENSYWNETLLKDFSSNHLNSPIMNLG